MPVTISGFITGILFTAFHSMRGPFFMEKKPMAAKVPTTVKKQEASNAMENVTSTASIMPESVNT